MVQRVRRPVAHVDDDIPTYRSAYFGTLAHVDALCSNAMENLTHVVGCSFGDCIVFSTMYTVGD